jgi:phage baseplate assembly protein gpV
MRTTRDKKKMEMAKIRSLNTQQTLVIEDNQNREFFRFEDGVLLEYDRTRANTHGIRLTEEELESINEMWPEVTKQKEDDCE